MLVRRASVSITGIGLKNASNGVNTAEKRQYARMVKLDAPVHAKTNLRPSRSRALAGGLL